jgi:hypothetical protein
MEIQNIGLEMRAPASGIAAYNLNVLFVRNTTSCQRSDHATRHHVALDGGGELIVDQFADNNVVCCFARFHHDAQVSVRLEVEGEFSLDICPAGGWLLNANGPENASYWFPRAPMYRRLDAHGHILSERPASIGSAKITRASWAIQLDSEPTEVLDCLAWRIPSDSNELRQDLAGLDSIEAQAVFLWGTHDSYSRPSDLYLHLIHGHIYENRASWPCHWRICSENDAHALYVSLSGLEAATGKQLYGLLKSQVLLSVIARQSADGGWRHGEWTPYMESHFRLHCSAMHLLMDALAERDCEAVRDTLKRAAQYLSRQTDKLDHGVWFLHDELEHRVEAMREGPFRWVPSQVVGKSPSDMLVLNSHLDASVALHRYREIMNDDTYDELINQAQAATHAVLALRSADLLYRSIFSAVELTFLPTRHAMELPAYRRALKRLAWKYLIPLLPRIKAVYPRIVMPGGYIERELSLRLFAFEYLPINLMDLLRFRREFRDPSVDTIIEAGLRLVHRCSMCERWLEVKGKEYAVGFWAEALYHACMLYDELDYREWLAQAVIMLNARQMGLPPSLFGANREAVPLARQIPTPILNNGALSIVNLSREDVVEILIVNHSAITATPTFVRNEPGSLDWIAASDLNTTAAWAPDIPAGSWIRGRSRTIPVGLQ